MEFRMPERSEYGIIAIVIMRIMLGWMMIWAFFDKLLGLGYATPAGFGWIDGGSPSSFVTWMTSGAFADFFNSLAGNGFVDFILMAGCLGLGVTLLLGFASRITTVLMIVFLVFMLAIHIPPSDNPIFDYHIFYMAAMAVVYFCGGFDKFSINAKWKELPLVRDLTILQ